MMKFGSAAAQDIKFSLQLPLDIFGQQIGLDIHCVANLQRTECRMSQCVRDEGHAEALGLAS